LLPQIVGLGFASELCLTGRIIDSAEAERIGLVNRVFSHDDLLAEALKLGDEIAFNPTRQVSWAKQMLYTNATNDNMRSVLQGENEIFAQATRSDARAEAALAFRERRDPNFHS
jgi:enoyl-CoA hydratase/carnithine racemase